MYSDVSLQSANIQSASLAASRDNGSIPTQIYADRRHSRSKSNSASASYLLNANGDTAQVAGKRVPPSSSGTPAARPQTAPFRADKQVTPDRSPDNYPAKFAAGAPSPGSKRRSSLAEGAESWTGSPATPKGEEREHKRRSSFARRLSFGTNGGLFNGGLTTSPTRRRNAADTRRRSPDSSPQKRRSFHSPPPPGGRVTSQLPPISTLPSLPKLSFEPLSSSVGTPSPSAGLISPGGQDPNTSDYFSTKNNKLPKSPKRRRDVSIKSRLEKTGADTTAGAEDSTTPNGAYRSTSNSSSLTLSTTAFGPTNPHASQSTTRDRSASEASLGPNTSGGSSTPSRKRDRRERDKKVMLSRALQKANTAVLLDNAQNFEGAVEAYGEACGLLQHVMEKSSTDEDKAKLDAIRTTYTNRMQELYELKPALYQSASGKDLPPRPDSEAELQKLSSEPPASDDEEQAVIQTATMTRIVNDQPMETTPQRSGLGTPSGRESTLSSAIKAVENSLAVDNTTSFFLQSPIDTPAPALHLEIPMDKSYMPPPLSPRPPPSPTAQEAQQTKSQENLLRPPVQKSKGQHSRDGSGESVSWLDTIDESGSSSCRSSVHSRSSNGELRRKALTGRQNRPDSQGTEAEFDAALDAAVEAAYADGMDPYDKEGQILSSGDNVRTALRNVEVAKERVREAEREEAIHTAKSRERERLLKGGGVGMPPKLDLEFGPYGDDDDDDAEEEERMLDEMTREYMLDGFDFGLQSKSALPRQSDGSEFGGSTWNSSRSSNRTTGTTAATALSSLSTVAESERAEKAAMMTSRSLTALPTVSEMQYGQATTGAQKPSLSRPSTSGAGASKPTLPPPTGALPQVPQQQPGVRSRRMSGQNAKQLKIETSVLNKQLLQKKQADLPPPSGSAGSTPATLPPKSPAVQPGLAAGVYQPSSDAAGKMIIPVLDRPITAFATSPAETHVTVSPATPGLTKAMSNDTGLVPPSPGMLGKNGRIELRKNKSSLSLKASRQLSVSSPDVSDGGSIATPMSTTFSNYSTRTKGSTLVNSSVVSERTLTNLSNSTVLANNPPMPGMTTSDIGPLSSGMHLFDSDIHSPSQPGSPNPLAFAPPAPLEPCPCSHLLRPFWLMRCLYQTMAHPRGGYLSTKLFVPREIWKTKGLKLKSVDDKIANCDLLSAALGKLARVDMIDADAVLEEMQSLEQVLDQVQASLQKKLGSDVGVSGVGQLFKDAPVMTGEGGNAGNESTGTRTSGGDKSRSYLSSWRKLRSKNSAAGLTSLSTGGLGLRKDGSGLGNEEQKNAPTLPTVPMTSLPNIRFTKREPEKADFGAGIGPLGNYMESLARLCDAVQVVDTIARQVEDPGLKAASSTHVGLELCARHASEFFGFYVCRFVLTDVGIMLDKFLKRSSEWVLV